MAVSDRHKKLLADIERTMEMAREGDPHFWRHPLAEATVALLSAGVPVTIDSLIAKLEVPGDPKEPDVALRRGVSKAAIDRLREIVVKKD